MKEIRPFVPDHEPDYKSLYFELLFAVGHKHPGESRHQTALRYIRQAEQQSAQDSGTKQEKTPA
jgi:hypothetical protein